MFPVKHTVIYTFFAITSVQNTCFCSVFNALASKNPAKSCYVQCFFSFLAVFPLPESYQNDPKFHFNTLLRSDTQKSSKNVENTTVFWSRCETVFGVWSRCETVFGPPPPAKADIATAILTNVIEHLVLLLPPNKHAFTAKAVWADLQHAWKHVERPGGSHKALDGKKITCSPAFLYSLAYAWQTYKLKPSYLPECRDLIHWHVFESDAVDSPLRPMASRYCGCSVWTLAPFLFVVFWCFAVWFAVSAGETQVWLEICGSSCLGGFCCSCVLF